MEPVSAGGFQPALTWSPDWQSSQKNDCQSYHRQRSNFAFPSGLGSRRWFRRFVWFRLLVWLRLLGRLGLLRCLRWFGSFRRLDGDQLNFEHQCAVGRDGTAAGLSVSKVRRNKKLPLGPGGHQLQCFRPSLDDAVEGEGHRFTVLGRAVKLRAVDKSAAIVTGHGIGGCGLRAGPGRQDLILQAVGQGYNAFLGLIGGEESLSLFLILRGNFRAHVGLPLLQGGTLFLLGQQSLPTARSIF